MKKRLLVTMAICVMTMASITACGTKEEEDNNAKVEVENTVVDKEEMQKILGTDTEENDSTEETDIKDTEEKEETNTKENDNTDKKEDKKDTDTKTDKTEKKDESSDKVDLSSYEKYLSYTSANWKSASVKDKENVVIAYLAATAKKEGGTLTNADIDSINFESDGYFIALDAIFQAIESDKSLTLKSVLGI